MNQARHLIIKHKLKDTLSMTPDKQPSKENGGNHVF